MVVSIHQPSLFPWLGLLDKIAKGDSFVFLDDVPANKAAYQYRNIFYCNGEPKFIGLPVDYAMNKKICDLQFKNNNWKNEHLTKLVNYYRKAPFFREIMPQVESLYEGNYDRPVDFIIESMRFAFKCFGINVYQYKSSDLNHIGDKGSLVLSLCKCINADTYLSGSGARDYMDDELLAQFKNEGVSIQWHHFAHPKYKQVEGIPFLEGLSFLDILFFVGVKEANSIFWSNVKGVLL